MYPSWRYHRTLPARIVDGPEEDEALGDEWADTPAAFLEDAPPESAPDEPPEESDDSEKTATTKKKRTR